MDKKSKYQQAETEIRRVLDGCKDEMVVMATIPAILKHSFPYYFWVGFYRVVADDLLAIGPYQGTLGCLEIPFSKGVCGHCATTKQTVIVPDVHEFPGHIACDSKSQSEIVVSMFNKDSELIAVFDVDSTERNSFDEVGQQGLEVIMELFAEI